MNEKKIENYKINKKKYEIRIEEDKNNGKWLIRKY